MAYDSGAVVPLQVAPGYQLTVEFAPDETIENIAVGDSNGWLVSANKRGDRMFIKPGPGAGATNLTVMTGARTYVFDLNTGSGNAIYVLRFQYPGAAALAPDKQPNAAPGRYKLSGAKSIRPDAMSDDGSKTYIIWRPDQPLPAVFAVGGDGRETLTDSAMRDGRLVIDSIYNRLVFRRDRDTVQAVRVPRLKP